MNIHGIEIDQTYKFFFRDKEMRVTAKWCDSIQTVVFVWKDGRKSGFTYDTDSGKILLWGRDAGIRLYDLKPHSTTYASNQ